jgi:hypothetical protein
MFKRDSIVPYGLFAALVFVLAFVFVAKSLPSKVTAAGSVVASLYVTYILRPRR